MDVDIVAWKLAKLFEVLPSKLKSTAAAVLAGEENLELPEIAYESSRYHRKKSLPADLLISSEIKLHV